MTFQQILRNYLSELNKEVLTRKSGETTAELSFRTSLDNFFKTVVRNIDPAIVTIPEPKNQNRLGRPDWRFHNEKSMGVYGYVEAKGLDEQKDINREAYRSQIGKYLTLGNPVILTDGIDFIIFKPNGEETKFSACKKPIDWNNLDPNFDLETLFLVFFDQIGHRVISDTQLVTEVAKRAKLLTSEVNDFLQLEEDETESETELATVSLLKQLQEAAASSHDKTLGNEFTFASFISQVLTFGLLYAHRVVHKKAQSPTEKYQLIHEFWFSVLHKKYTSKLMPFKTLVQGLEAELGSELSRLGLWYDDLRRLLAHIQLSENQIEAPDYHELYEIFLSKYDPETRFDYGAFYTPRDLAFYTVLLAKEVIRTTNSNITINSKGNKIIDPCCGTGTFIEAILETVNPNDEIAIIGFEILPAPYALAHYRMSILRDQYPENIQVKLTNTLSDSLFNLISEENRGDSDLSHLLEQEQQQAYKLATPPLTLLIGNPPSSDSIFQIQNEGTVIKSLLNDFRPENSGRSARQNTQKQLSNEFVKFLRWTVDRALKSKPSVFALIIPSSFLKHPSYKFARKFIVGNFNNIWVLEFDSDLRTGTGNVNLFETQQGRCILIANTNEESAKVASVKYRTIVSLTKSEKIDFFKTRNINLERWAELELDQTDYCLKPKKEFDSEEYDRFWPITASDNKGIFLRHCSGVKLAPTHLLVHSSVGQLKRRSKFIAKKENDYSAIKSRWYEGQKKIPNQSKITDGIRSKLGDAVRSNSISKYSYRPFLEINVILDNPLLNELKNLGGGGTRVRPEVRAAYNDEKVFGFIVSPAPEDLGDSLHKFSSFCWHLPDNDLSKRGSARVFCNYFPEYKRKNQWDPTLKNNINQGLLDQLIAIFGLAESDIIPMLTFYSYAMLSSSLFLRSFEGALFGVAGNWPKIPITKDKHLFTCLSDLGEALAKIERSEYRSSDISIKENELYYHKYSLVENGILLKNASGDIIKQFSGIDPDIINFEVSGYKVLKEWLKIHSFPYYRKPLDQDKLLELESLIEKLSEYLEKIDEIDTRVEEILSSDLLKSKSE